MGRQCHAGGVAICCPALAPAQCSGTAVDWRAFGSAAACGLAAAVGPGGLAGAGGARSAGLSPATWSAGTAGHPGAAATDPAARGGCLCPMGVRRDARAAVLFDGDAQGPAGARDAAPAPQEWRLEL